MVDLARLKEQISQSIVHLKTVDSTSLYMSRLIRDKNYVPRLVIAECQTNGQGRRGKSFYSPSSTGLYLTFSFSTKELICQDLTPRVALAARAAIQQVFGVDCGVKWVNDLYYNGKKVCGILCQRVCEYTLIGIGINVEEPERVPEEILNCFGALCRKCEKEKYTDLVLALNHFLCFYFLVPVEQVLSEFRENCFHLNKGITLLFDGKKNSGLCVGIGDDFSILIRINDSIRSFSSGTLLME